MANFSSHWNSKKKIAHIATELGTPYPASINKDHLDNLSEILFKQQEFIVEAVVAGIPEQIDESLEIEEEEASKALDKLTEIVRNEGVYLLLTSRYDPYKDDKFRIILAKDGLYRPKSFYRYHQGPTSTPIQAKSQKQDGWFDKQNESVRNQKDYFVYSNGRFYVVNGIVFWPYPYDQLTQGEDYWNKVQELDKTKAGKRARDLFISKLPNEKRQEEFRKHYETIITYSNPYYVGLSSDKVKRQLVYKIRYKMVPHARTDISVYSNQREKWTDWFNLCLHPQVPFPSGDILLAHHLMGPKKLLAQGNW